MYFPTSLQLVDYYKLATELDLPIRGGGLQALTGVGTREGKVLVYRVDSQETKLLSKTKGGLIFGAVASLSIMENGTNMVVSSESGELLSFDLISTIKDQRFFCSPLWDISSNFELLVVFVHCAQTVSAVALPQPALRILLLLFHVVIHVTLVVIKLNFFVN